MSAAHLEAYRTAKNSANMSGREIEAAALTRCALMLSDCLKDWDAPGRDAKLDEALRTNQRVWSILQGELTIKDNPLPKQLKEDLLSLSIFIDKRTIQVMAHPVPEKIKILIEINLNIAAGLEKTSDNEGEDQVIGLPAKRPALTSIHV
jgi:flagellar biosynthesis activator protein FlaF